jgi:hypothetical protein
MYRISNEVRVALRTIYTLGQTGSVTAYYSEFQKLAKELNWKDENAFKDIFYNGLKGEIRRKMMKPPEIYKEMVEEAIKIDNRLYKLRMEESRPNQKGHGERITRRGRGGYHNQYRGRHHRGTNYGDPMDLDLTYAAKGASRAGNIRGRGQGRRHREDKEKDRRRKENLYFECGKSGHRARECQSSARGLHIMNMEGGDAGGSVG